MIDLSAIEGFEWDDSNEFKNWRKHGVSPKECEEIFFNIPLLLSDDVGHSQEEVRYFALGKTNQRRYLFVVFTLRRRLIRVISARDMTKKERSSYQTGA